MTLIDLVEVLCVRRFGLFGAIWCSDVIVSVLSMNVDGFGVAVAIFVDKTGM